MRKLFWTGGIVLAALFGSGNVGTAADYATIAWGYVVSFFDQSEPIALKLERFAVALSQVDSQIEKNARILAQESVAIDRFAETLRGRQAELASLKSDLGEQKSRFVCADCDDSKNVAKKKMISLVKKYESRAKTVERDLDTLKSRRSNYEKMDEAFERQKLARQELQGEYESQKALYASMQMRGELSGSEFDAQGIAKATALATSIADRLEVEHRVFTRTEDLGDEGSSARPATETTLNMDVVDAILGSNNSVAVR